MFAFVIEQDGQIKEAFGYEIRFNEKTHQSIVEYARAQYGPDATVRNLHNPERSQFSPTPRLDVIVSD
jgi:hypothetical protein